MQPAGSSAPVSPAPVASSERVVAIDVLRGIAILGILLVNIDLFRGPGYLLALAGELDVTGLDRALSILISALAEGKFITSLSFLFGLGFALQGMRAEARGGSPGRLLARRMTILMGIGIAHGVLIWSGDILLTYALIGFVFLLFFRRRPRALLIAAGVIAALVLLVMSALVALALLARAIDTGQETAGAPAAPADFFRELAVSAEEAYTSGSYSAMVEQRLRELAIFLPLTLITFGPMILVMMLLGAAVPRAGWVTSLAEQRRTIRRVAIVGLAVGLPLNILYALLFHRDPAGETVAGVLAFLLLVIGAPVLALGYLSVATLLTLRAPGSRPVIMLAAVGRLALTNYLAQSVIMTGIFYGFGLFGQVSLAVALLLGIGVIALQLILSPIYLRHFSYGPVEWLWRALTYGRAGR